MPESATGFGRCVAMTRPHQACPLKPRSVWHPTGGAERGGEEREGRGQRSRGSTGMEGEV